MTQPVPGHDWIAIVRKHGTAEFGKAFAAHPTLDASVLGGPCVGLAAIAAFFAATSGGMYETLRAVARSGIKRTNHEYEWMKRCHFLMKGPSYERYNTFEPPLSSPASAGV